MTSGGSNFNYFTENQLTKFSAATVGLLVNFGHTLSVGLLVRPWPYRPCRRRRPCGAVVVRIIVLQKYARILSYYILPFV